MSSDYIPMSAWSKDHWSTFAYVESVAVECAGFQVGNDPRMKSNRRHFRMMNQECPRPNRPAGGRLGMAMVMAPEHATVIQDGTVVSGHDDWMCVQDMSNEGLFTVDAVQPGETLHLSAKGLALAARLRQHKTFLAPLEAEAPATA